MTAVAVTDKIGNDSPYLIPFLKTTAENFEVLEVSADKAYLSKKNLRAIEAAGATPYIPFKVNSVRFNPKQKRDEVWIRAYDEYHYNRREFREHYHKRSNAESGFWSIKSKFGGSVRSKTPTAQVNEVLVKVLCHNICCLIRSMYELGAEVSFNAENPN